MARRLSSPVFVGRVRELQTLVTAADAVASGSPALLLIGGEAGVGKSRLVAELTAAIRDREWLVLEGGTVALGDDGLPFGPIVEALRALVRDVDRDRIAAAAGPSLPELARLVPELSTVVDDGAAPAGQIEWLQTRVFEGILRLLGRLGEQTPILLVIEDLHWADRSTRDLLAFLARNARDERLLIVGTFRTDELHRRHPLTAWLAEAERQPRVERIDLARFERGELVELLAAIGGTSPTPALVESIARRSDGNAFFAEELIAAVDETGQRRERLPETLRGVLLVHLSAATERARRLVEIAAVAGREVDHEVLAEVCELSDAEMRAALHEAVDAQLLVVGLDDELTQYRFRHALVQEAAYDELLPSERRTLHGAYARSIDARPVGGGAAAASRLVELAHHWTAAHEPARALAAAIDAGDASRAVYAYADAVRQYERAIELWDIVPVDDRPPDRDVIDLYDSASAAATLVGDAERAVSHAQRAIELVDAMATSDGGTGSDAGRERRAKARERGGSAAWLAGDTATSIRLLEEAVGLLEGTPPSIRKTRVLAGLAHTLMLAGRSGESVPFAQGAIEAARAIGDQSIETLALNVLGVDLASLGNIAAAIELLRRSLALALELNDPTEVPRAYANLGSVLEMGGLVEEALEVTLAGAESARRYSTELSFRTFLEVNAAGMLVELARYPEAARLLERNADRVLPGVTTIHLNLTLAHLHLQTGDLAAADQGLAIARAEASGLDDAQFTIDIHSFGTEVALWGGDPTTALAIARDGFDRLVDMDDAIILGQLALPAVRAAADLAVMARAARHEVAAGSAVAATHDIIGRYEAAISRLAQPDDLAAGEIAWRVALCGAELARANGADEPAGWDAVRPALTARPAPFLEAYVLWRTAEALAGKGETAAAGEPLREGYTIATTIGAGQLVSRLEGLGRRLRVDLAPVAVHEVAGDYGAQTPTLEPSGPDDPFGLTVREREVLALVSEGYTNRRIADTLFISESTAGVHVSHILAKLGVDTRTEAAAVAVRLGLDREPGS